MVDLAGRKRAEKNGRDFQAEKPQSQKHKDATRAAALMHRLERFVLAEEGDKDYDSSQITPAHVQAINVMLKKLIPDLSSVEQTIVDERDSMSEEEILSQLQMVIANSPDIAAKLRAMLSPTAVPYAIPPEKVEAVKAAHLIKDAERKLG